MTGLSSRCPDPEAIAAFVMGNLSGAELKTMAEHLRECDDCREIAAEAAWIDREGVTAATVVPLRPQAERRWPWWLYVAAAALAGMVFLALWSVVRERHENLMGPLVEAAPRDGRYLEPRLSGGFPWAPLRAVRRATNEPLDPEQMKLIGAAGNVLQKASKQSSAEAQHAAAVAHLLAGRPDEAADLLSKTAEAAPSPQIWSDLAAMLFAASMKTNDSTRLAEALAAADAALRLDGRFAEALFNRALILQRLGLREEARTAWERYLVVDTASPWANEARQHLRDLEPVAEFRHELQERYSLLIRDRSAVQAVASRFPQEARVWGETEILGRWAEALQRGDHAEAESHLNVARGFAENLEQRGDSMLSGMVSVIERADPRERTALVQAHMDFRAAQRTFKTGAPGEAEKLFRAARAAFEEGGSPATLLAQYFVANTAYDQGRLDEARQILERLAGTTPRQYPAHRAQVLWQLGLVDAAAGRWGHAIRSLRESASTFERLGENRYAGTVRNILAEVYDRLGDRRAAWQHRIVALRELGRSDPSRLPSALDAAARAAAVNREWNLSLSLRSLQIGILERGSNAFPYIEALLQRARIHSRVGETQAAVTDFTRATNAMERLRDPAVRERAEADRLAVEALLVASPAAAVAKLSRAIEFHRVKGRRMHLPELLLLRGKAHAALKDLPAAADDFEAGIRELETQRRSVSARDRGWGNFAIAEDLFDEAIGLAITRGDGTGAFLYAERARSRDDESANAIVQASSTAGNDVVVVEYAALPAHLAIFVIDGPVVRVVVRPAREEDLTVEIERMTQSAMKHDVVAFRRASATLYQRLVAPVAEEIDHARTVVFVPDATLGPVPFSALVDDDGRYLIERHAVIITPSRATFTRLSARPRVSHGPSRLLLVAGPASREGDFGSIAAAQREMKAVASVYGVEHRETPQQADVDSFAGQASDADIIHFVGHAVIPDGSAEAALVTSGDTGLPGMLEASEITAMKFSRTRIVVLAACGTARSRERPGQTSISIAHAFLAAGVPTVVATLWPIDDGPAADFFPRFHRRLVRGDSPAEALRAAQLESIQLGDTLPSLWAAVQIIGS